MMAFWCCCKLESLKSRGEQPALYSLWFYWAGEYIETLELQVDHLEELCSTLEELSH
jgi:hypothetical protein